MLGWWRADYWLCLSAKGLRGAQAGGERVEGPSLSLININEYFNYKVDVQTTVLALISYSTRPLGITSIPQLETDDRWMRGESRNVWVVSYIIQRSHNTVQPCTNKGIANAWPWRRKTWTWFTVFGSFHLFSHHYQNNTRFQQNQLCLFSYASGCLRRISPNIIVLGDTPATSSRPAASPPLYWHSFSHPLPTRQQHFVKDISVIRRYKPRPCSTYKARMCRVFINV